MTPLEALRFGLEQNFPYQEGERYSWDLPPGLSEAEIGAFEGKLGNPVPLEIAELLGHCQGIPSYDLGEIILTGYPELSAPKGFEHGLVIGQAPDGIWFVDIDPLQGDWGWVGYYHQKMGVMAIQAASITDFILQLFHKAHDDVNWLDRIRQKSVGIIREQQPGLISFKKAMSQADMAGFAGDLKGRAWKIIDLRKPQPGQGIFLWAYASIVRHPDSSIYALAPPSKNLWQRFLDTIRGNK